MSLRLQCAIVFGLGVAAVALWTGPGLEAEPLPPVHDLAAIEFVESPPTGLVVSGGLLGVPDSAGVFPKTYMRFDPASEHQADPGRVAGDALVFTNLRPGTYRLAMVFLSESRLAKRVLPKRGAELEDQCSVYSDSLPALTFTIGDGECRYLGRVIRRSMPSLAGDGLWKTSLEWSAGDERKVLKSMSKRKDLSAWRSIVVSRLSTVESSPGR